MCRNVLWIVVGILIDLVILGVTAKETQCISYPLKSDFEEMCKREFDGFIDGGRCFFMLDSPGDWEHAWTECTSKGAVLAQFHTLSEYQMVDDYVIANTVRYGGSPGYYDHYTWIALRDADQASPSCAVSSTTYWYDDVNSPNTNVPAMSTLAKYFECKDPYVLSSTPRCFALSWDDDQCSVDMYPVCQVTNLNQNFTQSGYCMTETPIETFPSDQAQTCGQSCSERAWCRSFNFACDSGEISSECQLFTRSIYDGDMDPSKAASVIAKSDTCIHYNYDR